MPTSGINLNGITTGTDGKLRVSGLSSNIDWKGIVDAQITAKRAPAIQLETKITKNNALVSAYATLKTNTAGIATALDKLRANPASSVDVFNTKSTSGSTAPSLGAPGGFVPSGINSLLLTSISNTAQNGTHTIKITQTAAAQQIRADSLSSTTATLSSLGVAPGSFNIGAKTITLSATDTLQDLRANINAAGAGVNATIVSASPTQNYLVVTATATGVANQLNFAGGTATSDALGLTAAGAVKTQLTAAQDAVLNVDGIAGITRSSNTISDVLTGVTLNLLKAEANTDITIKVETDLNSIKTAMAEFVEAYNTMRDYFTEQRTAADRNADGTVGDNEFGVLAYDQRLRDVVSRMGLMAATSVDSNADGFKSLSQIGIKLDADFKLNVDDATLDARLLANAGEIKKLFGFSATTTDSRATVLARTAETQSGTYYLNLAGTDASGNITDANFRATAGSGAGGAPDGSALASGQQVLGGSGNSKGLGVFFNGGNSLGPVNDIAITINRGVADQFFDFFNEQVRPGVGTLDTAVNELKLQNSGYEERIEVVDIRLAFVRATLENRFVKMETALAQLETLRSTIDSYLNSGNEK